MRRRRGEGVAETTVPDPVAPEGDTSPQVEMRMRGTADQVKRQLGANEQKPPEEKKPSDPTEEIEKFAALLRNPKYIVKVKRLRPKQWQGARANIEVWTSELPLQWEEIKSEVAENYKGGTYKVSVINPETGGVLDARNFEVEGDPFLESAELTPEEQEMFGQKPKDAAQLTEEGLERTARMTAKQIEVETLQQNLKELRNRQDNGGKKSHESDSRIDDLERRLIEAKHQAEIERIQREADKKLDDVNKKLEQLLQQRQQPQGQSEISAILSQMQKSQEASDRRFDALQKQMQDDKLSAIQQSIESLKNRPQGQSGAVSEALSIVREVKKMFGAGDDEDDDEKDDDRPWWERALDKLADKLTEPVIDKLLSKFDGIEKEGKQVSKEEFMKDVDQELQRHAAKIAEEEIQKIKAREQRSLPPPERKNPPVREPARTPGTGLPDRPQATALPPPEKTETPPPAASPPTPAASESNPSPAGPSKEMSIAQEKCYRVAGAITVFERELQFRTKEWEWTFEWWGGLPEDILEKVCTSPGPLEMFEAFKIEGMNVEELEKMKLRITENPKALAWVKLGMDELHRWWEKSQKDPNFNPEDEEEDEGGEGTLEEKTEEERG